METPKKRYREISSCSSSNICSLSNRKRTKRAQVKRKKSVKRTQKMKEIQQYHAKFVDLFKTVCKGKVDLGSRLKDSFWKRFSFDFNLTINCETNDEQEKVNFTGDECKDYAMTLRRHTKLKIAGSDQDRLSDLFNFKMPTMSPSKKSKTGTTSTGRSTAATLRMFTLDEVMDLTREKRRMLVLQILTNLEGLGVSDFRKVNSYCAKDEDLINMILMCNPTKRLAKVQELLQIINAQGE